MSNNITTTREDVNVTVTESLNDSIFKSLSRLESRLNEVLLMLETMPCTMDPYDRHSDFNISEAWEKQIRDAVMTACRRTGSEYDPMPTDVFVDTVIAILKGHNED